MPRKQEPIDIMGLRQNSIMSGMGGMDPSMMDFGDSGMNYDDSGQGFNPLLPGRPNLPTQSAPLPSTPTPQYEIPRAPQQMGVQTYADIPGITELMNQFTPETASRDRFNSLIDAFPERNNPGWGRKLVASGMGLGSKDPLATMESVLQAPYIRDVAGWKERAGPTYQAAQLENQANVNERQVFGNAVTADVNARRYAEQARNTEEKNRITEQKNADTREIGLINANANRARAEGAKIEIDDNSRQAYAAYPDGRIVYLGKVPGSSTAAEIANIKGGYQVQAAKQTGINQANTATIRGTDVYKTPDGKMWTIGPDGQMKPVTTGEGVTPSPGPATKIGTPSRETKFSVEQDRQGRMREMFNNPDHRKFFKEDRKTGNLIMEPKPSEYWKPEEAAHWDRVYAQVNPGFKPTGSATLIKESEATPTPSKPPTASTPPPSASSGIGEDEVRVIDTATGRPFRMRKSNLQRALSIRDENGKPRYQVQ